MARLNMSSPWVIFYKELDAFFKDDPEVTVVYNDVEMEVNLYVDNGAKAGALEYLLPSSKTYGAVTININIIPANEEEKTIYNYVKTTGKVGNELMGLEDYYYFALENHGAFVFMDIIDIMTNKMIFIVFAKEVVQYFTDDLGDIHGVCSTLYQEIAKNIFEKKNGVFFCTDIE